MEIIFRDSATQDTIASTNTDVMKIIPRNGDAISFSHHQEGREYQVDWVLFNFPDVISIDVMPL